MTYERKVKAGGKVLADQWIMLTNGVQGAADCGFGGSGWIGAGDDFLDQSTGVEYGDDRGVVSMPMGDSKCSSSR